MITGTIISDKSQQVFKARNIDSLIKKFAKVGVVVSKLDAIMIQMSNYQQLTTSWKNMWHKLSDNKKALFTSLENFDAKKFLHITGIDVNQK